MVSVDGARLKRSCVLDDQKDVFKLGVHCRRDHRRVLNRNLLPGFHLLERPKGHAGAAGELGHACVMTLHPLRKVDFAYSCRCASADASLLEVCIKRGEVGGFQVSEPDVADRLIDARQLGLIFVGCLFLQVRVRVALHEQLGKLLKTDTAVTDIAVLDLLFKQHSLPVQFLLELALRHARSRHPRHVLAQLLPIDVVAGGDGYLVAFALLFYRGHCIFSFHFV